MAWRSPRFGDWATLLTGRQALLMGCRPTALRWSGRLLGTGPATLLNGISLLGASMNCSTCNREGKSKNGRLPPRWKWLPKSESPCCPRCWSKRYMMRAVTIPVQGPDATGNPTDMAEAWKALRERLRSAWDQSTMLANWTVQQLQRLDVTRASGQEKIQPMPQIYLYGLFAEYAHRAQWEGAAASAQSIFRTVESCWREERWDVIWLYDRSARTYRWPTPFPVHNANWRLEKSDQGIWICSLAFPSGRLGLRLRNDRTMHYQRRRLEQLLSGEAVAGEAAIYARPVQGNDRYNGMQIRGPGGRQDYRVLLKLAAWFPRPAMAEKLGELSVHTGNDALIYAEQDAHEPWIYNGDELRRRIIGHLAMLKRHSDDTKAERRFPAAMRRRHNEDMQLRCEKHNRYVQSALAEIASMIIGLARRRRISTIAYDHSERGFIPKMDYSSLQRMVEEKSKEFGIEFKNASSEVVDENPEPARVEEGVQ